MKIKLLFFAVLFIIVLFTVCTKPSTVPRILVFSKTAGFHHTSIANGIVAIQKLGTENNFIVDTTTDASNFNDTVLHKYAAVLFLSTTGTLFTSDQRTAFEKYIQAGGGYVGVHAATDAEYGWQWYNHLCGAYFLSHPQQQEAKLIVKDRSHLSTKHLPAEWIRKDEWYNFKQIDTTLKVLITIDEKSYTGGENGDAHPMAWYHEYDGGRAFYTALGHTEESYTEPLFLQHLLGGIQYAMGKK